VRQKLTQEKYDSIPTLLEQGLNKTKIAEQFGVTTATLIVQCSRRGISLSRHGRRLPVRSLSMPDAPLDLEQPVLAKLREQARFRGTSEIDLIKQLLRTIVLDDLYTAVLDEEPA